MDLVDQADFRLLDRKAVMALRQLRERARFVRGLVRWIGFRQVALPYRARRRHAGASGYSLRQLARMGMAGLLNFSVLPIRLVAVGGALFLAAAMLYLAAAGILSAYVPSGFSPLIFLVLLTCGVQMMAVASVAEYVGRIYEEAKGRPLYIVREAQGFDEQPGGEESRSDRPPRASRLSLMT